MEKQKLIDSFHKNSIEVIKVQLQEWKSQEYVDIRVWYLEKPGEPGNEKPTHKGITLNVELLPKLIQALQQAQGILDEVVAGDHKEKEKK